MIYGALHYLPTMRTLWHIRGQPEYDRLTKVHPVITALQNLFLEAYKPHRENAIDEAMIKFRRSSLKQYLPMKPIKHRFKEWRQTIAIASCATSIFTQERRNLLRPIWG